MSVGPVADCYLGHASDCWHGSPQVIDPAFAGAAAAVMLFLGLVFLAWAWLTRSRE